MRRALVVSMAVLLWLPGQAAAKTGHFKAKRAGEAFLDVRALAPGADWGRAGRESAVVTITLDGRYNQDVVLFNGAKAFDYEVALGPVRRGRHTVRARFSRAKSPAGVKGAKVKKLKASVPRAKGVAALAQRYSPVVYGRDLPEIPGRFENANTDVPLLSYHVASRDPDGNRVLEYTVIWSNEDGGTNTPQLMARWGRTTDIEWIYRVTLDARGRVLSQVYQAPDHATNPFTGARLGSHPMLQTGTSNNNMVQVDDPKAASGYRFIPDTRQTLPANRAREAVMDANPWTYQVMAKEMIREGKVEPVASPATPEMSDQRNYLFAEVDKDTAYPTPPPADAWVGTALLVKLAGDDTWYSSHHGVPDSSIQRDDPAATTVELPAGTTADDVEAVKAVAVPVGAAPPDYRITVTSLNRGFFLGKDVPAGRVVPVVARERDPHERAAGGGDLAAMRSYPPREPSSRSASSPRRTADRRRAEVQEHRDVAPRRVVLRRIGGRRGLADGLDRQSRALERARVVLDAEPAAGERHRDAVPLVADLERLALAVRPGEGEPAVLEPARVRDRMGDAGAQRAARLEHPRRLPHRARHVVHVHEAVVGDDQGVAVLDERQGLGVGDGVAALPGPARRPPSRASGSRRSP